ncbi:GNAT family N-acetyltransferase [Parvicella tangerina]|uniref:Acetyltransferase n=1 Tax=Parvicella tangerina TaxID=2829795 RepID=A0A916JN48_9FLAO|nr:GNAT family N-acetyltransferase [Parvicella tangerina]CAG5083251.1 Acetyltransferase [Parvicella tangerina]
MKEITTDRLILRKFKLSDVQDIYELDSDPDVHEFLGNNPISTIKECKEIIRGVLDQYEKYDIGRYAIELKETGEMVGWSGLKYETMLPQFGDYYDLGYRLKKAHWGKGIAFEAAVASLNFGFDELKLKKICAAAHVDNGASNHLLTKLGFVYKADFQWKNEPCFWYELTLENWNEIASN